jgi:hypothetical protein
MTETTTTSVKQQFLTNAAKASGAALTSLIGQILQHSELFTFGEFLALDSVKKVISKNSVYIIIIYSNIHLPLF